MKKLIITLAVCFLALMPFGLKAEAHGGIKSIELSPVEKTIKAGTDLTLTLLAKDSEGNKWDISENAYFEVNDPRGSMEKNVYKAGKVGKWKVTCKYGNFSASIKVTVVPGKVSHIQVNPNSRPETVVLNETKQFSALAFDKMSNLIKDAKVVWTTEGALGEINEEGLFVARDTGQGKITASVGKITASSDILVKEKTLLPKLEVVASNTAASTEGEETEATKTEEEEEVVEEEGLVAGVETTEAQTTEGEEEETCTTMAWYLWLLILAGFTAAMIAYYFFIRKSKNNFWWVFPLVLTVVAIWLYYQYSCNQYGWWPWVMIIVAILVTLFRPKKFFEEPQEPNF